MTDRDPDDVFEIVDTLTGCAKFGCVVLALGAVAIVALLKGLS
jgi:predicted RNA methylase